jgi:hypothetical protein
VLTNLIQPEAPPTIDPGRPISTPSGSDNSLGSFATALQSAVNSDSPVKTSSTAKPETQPRLPVGEERTQSPQQMLASVPVTLAPAPSVPVQTVESPGVPFSALPGKVGRAEVTQTESGEASTTNKSGRQPTTVPLSPLLRSPSVNEDAPSATALGSGTPVSPGSAAAAPPGFANPADPLMRLTQTPVPAPQGPVAVATTPSDNKLRPPVLTAANAAPDPSLDELGPMLQSVPSQVSSVPAPDVSGLNPTPAKVASHSQIDSVETAQASSVVLLPDPATVTSPTTGSQPPASLPVAGKPTRVLDTDARRVGSLPLRDLVPTASMFPQAAGVTANSQMLPQASKMTAAPNQPKPVEGISTAVLNSVQDLQGSRSSQSQDSASSSVHPDLKGKAPVADGPDPAISLAGVGLDSPALQRQIDARSDSLPAASPVSVIPTSPNQNAGSQPLATDAAESPAPHPNQVSADAVAATAGSVQTAHVVQGVAQSEMHIGFRSPAFGSVEVHTAVRDTQLGLAVSSERGDLRGFLAQEVPALQTVFHQQGLQFDQIRFVAPGSGTGTGLSSGSNSNSNSPENGRSPRSWFSQAAALEPDTATSEIQIGANRLSVHA